MTRSQEEAQVLLAVPRYLVKTIKNALQASQRLDKSAKIKPFSATEKARLFGPVEKDIRSCEEEKYLIPSTFMIRSDADEAEILMLRTALLTEINADQYVHQISIFLCNVSSSSHSSSLIETISLLGQVVEGWLLSISSLLFPHSISDLISVSTWSYTIYPPLLLLPQNTFSIPPWPELLSTRLRPHLQSLYILLNKSFKTTHIALNAPISALTQGRPNTLRKPQTLVPLHGSFGPSLSPTDISSDADFAAAFWCTVRQNGIFQTWAPRHTMFSRGNISEKTRLLSLNTLTAGGLGGNPPSEISAVDLYAGIGYFTFCYAKLGISKILCWELSEWSVEGLRRGSTENGWGVEVFKQDCLGALDIKTKPAPKDKQILVFQENNQNAAHRINALRSFIPPIRHVNCGFLPTSQESWETAVQALDPDMGGWIHAHENIERGALVKRREEIVEVFRELVGRWRGISIPTVKLNSELEPDSDRPEAHLNKNKNEMTTMTVNCIHLEQVKSYAPGVIHCVLDIAVLPCYDHQPVDAYT